MRKIAFWFSYLLLVAHSLYSLPLGNPLAPTFLYDCFCPYDLYNCCPGARCSIGFYGDYVWDRHLRVETIAPERDLVKTAINTQAGMLTIDFFQRTSLFVTAGTSHIRMQGSHALFYPSLSNERVYLEMDPGFSGSLGGRGILFECGCFSFGLETQFFCTWPSLCSIRSEGKEPIYLKNKRLTYWEYQIGCGLAYSYPISCIGRLSPYGGFKWSRVHAHCTSANDELIQNDVNRYFLRNFENTRDVGFCLGVSLVLNDKFVSSVEGNFSDENAVSTNIYIRF